MAKVPSGLKFSASRGSKQVDTVDRGPGTIWCPGLDPRVSIELSRILPKVRSCESVACVVRMLAGYGHCHFTILLAHQPGRSCVPLARRPGDLSQAETGVVGGGGGRQGRPRRVPPGARRGSASSPGDHHARAGIWSPGAPEPRGQGLGRSRSVGGNGHYPVRGQSWIVASTVKRRDWLTFSYLTPFFRRKHPSTAPSAHHGHRSHGRTDALPKAEVILHAVSPQRGYVASITRRRAELVRLLWDLSKTPLGILDPRSAALPG